MKQAIGTIKLLPQVNLSYEEFEGAAIACVFNCMSCDRPSYSSLRVFDLEITGQNHGLVFMQSPIYQEIVDDISNLVETRFFYPIQSHGNCTETIALL